MIARRDSVQQERLDASIKNENKRTKENKERTRSGDAGKTGCMSQAEGFPLSYRGASPLESISSRNQNQNHSGYTNTSPPILYGIAPPHGAFACTVSDMKTTISEVATRFLVENPNRIVIQ
jgi:hypothetical protein